ncbi:hypothetical protein [Cereibacter johrii]|uniref:hypothetical protein n=1 Tax=Cereibacter johrii TaxID=445629 RepID=UPI000DCD2E92|nr:hypothetical protein [Cereibacter johrii]RAZ83907.1 hypothetical protein DDV93_16660 [Cereibacter johrii]
MHKADAANPADELAEVRAAIARLRLREARLCATILAGPDSGLEGRHFRAEVAERRFRLFDAARLPEAVLADPRYWSESVTQEVRCLPAAVTAAPSRPRRLWIVH